jgi:hypothetical protein
MYFLFEQVVVVLVLILLLVGMLKMIATWLFIPSLEVIGKQLPTLMLPQPGFM